MANRKAPTFILVLPPFRHDDRNIPPIWIELVDIVTNHRALDDIFAALWRWWDVGIPSNVNEYFKSFWNRDRCDPWVKGIGRRVWPVEWRIDSGL